MKAEQLKGHLELLLLAVLEGRPAHGYAIIATLREQSEGAFDLPEGTVYPALHRLERAGQLRSAWADLGGRRRRVYQISGAGAAALAHRREEWSRFASGVDAVLGWSM
ncbi:MAG TPA: helix-turn-helix transcriptional regulator [Acidimicrobiales bacterium]|jgi:PadR family transcriptional regulator PadR|nr:helix-turn-helix transcriptional regulator [Acidimicrobiales bacterium]